MVLQKDSKRRKRIEKGRMKASPFEESFIHPLSIRLLSVSYPFCDQSFS